MKQKKDVQLIKIKPFKGFNSLNTKSIKFQNDKNNELSFKEVLRINQSANLISIFPLGDIICSSGKFILIFDINFKKIQEIKAHNDSILCISIKDDNNFITSSYDDLIRVWKKKEKKFILHHTMEKSHESWIYGLLYCPNYYIISCSHDGTIKIWDENTNYQCITAIMHEFSVDSLLFLEESNILISLGDEGIKSWNMTNLTLINHNENAYCIGWSHLIKMGKDRIIIIGDLDSRINIIEIKSLKQIKQIDFGVKCYGICVFENKNIFLVSGKCNNLHIYDSISFKCLKIIEKIHNDDLSLCKLNSNNLFLSYSKDGLIKVWAFNL